MSSQSTRSTPHLLPTPMALVGMTPVEITGEAMTDPKSWSWTPPVKDAGRLTDAMLASNNTSKETWKGTTDHGENK